MVWALTGSTSFALQGVPVVPGDIDVQTDERGAYVIQDLLRDKITRPVTLASSGQIRSHFGAVVLHGVEVEIIGWASYASLYGPTHTRLR